MLRLFKVLLTLARYRLDLLLRSASLPLWVSFLLLPLKLFPEKKYADAERLRLALESLGPIYVKMGQLLSTRKDLIHPDIASELEKLQDDVEPFDSQLAKATIEKALGQKVETIFADFDIEPLASASIAQVHAATLLDGKQVVVKVVRPGIERVIEQDMRMMQSIAAIVGRLHPDGKRLHLTEVVADYKTVIFDELNLQQEAANTAQLRRNFKDSDLLYIPEIYWDYCCNNVLVIERIDGIPVTDVEQLNANNINLESLAKRGVEIFFTQVFRDSFFHADMHPGNIFVSKEHQQKPQYIGIDCAIIGTLNGFDQYYLARNMYAIFEHDYRLVAELHIECGWVPADTKVGELESAIRTVCEPIFEKPLGEISFGQVLLSLFQTARRFNMEVQPSLVLLQKTLLHVEGMGRQLYPELNLWDTAKPFLEQWLKDRYSPKAVLKKIKRYGPSWLENFPQVPDLIFDSLKHSSATHNIDEQQKLLKALAKQQRIQNIMLAVTLFSLAFVLIRLG